MSEAGERPFAVLERYVAQEASGELICVGTAETHVYLQRGRIAWATDSRHPLAFTSCLQAATGITDATFRDVLEECRRGRLPLGETLVLWQLATPEQVRDALRRQIDVALGLLREEASAQTVFLERGQLYASYRADLTFSLYDVVPSEVPPSSADGSAICASVDATEVDVSTAMLSRLCETNHFAWVELLQGTKAVQRVCPSGHDAGGAGGAPRVPNALLVHTLLDGATQAALRTDDGSILGIVLRGEDRTLWCEARDFSSFGAAMGTLANLASDPRSGAAAPGRSGRREAWAWGERSAETSAILAFVAQAPEVRGVLLSQGGGERLTGVDPSGGGGDGIRALVGRRARALVARGSSPSSPAAVGRRRVFYRSLITAERDVWCFGRMFDERPGAHHQETLWLLVDRSAPQGLGWAYLNALLRQVRAPGPPRG